MLITSTQIIEACIPDKIEDVVSVSLKDMYLKSELLDVTISCSDGVIVEAHKLILAAYSKYFRILFTGPMAREHSLHVETHLDFSSTTVRFFVDTLYKSDHSEERKEHDVDLIEFTMLVDFLDISNPEIITEGLRLAVEQLTPENCILELNKSTPGENHFYPRWIQVITYFICENLVSEDLVLENDVLEMFTKDSLVCLISSTYIKFCSLEIFFSLLSKLLTFLKDENTDFVETDLLSAIDWFIINNLNSSEEYEVELLAKLQRIMGNLKQILLLKHNDDANEEIDLGPLSLERSDDIVLKMIDDFDSGLVIEYVFYPQPWRIKATDFVEDDEFQFILDVVHVATGFFVYKNSLYAVDPTDEKDKLRLLQYKALHAEWEIIVTSRLPIFMNNHDNEDAEFDIKILSCFVKDHKAFISLGFGPSWKQSYMVIIFDLQCSPPSVNKFNLKRDRIVNVVMEEDDLILFKSPYLSTTLEMYYSEGKIFHQVSHSKEEVTFGSLVTYRGKTFHIYTYKNNEHELFIDEFDFAGKRWIEQEAKLSDDCIFVEAFVANDELFITYRRTHYDYQKKKGDIFIGRCYKEEIGPGKYAIKLRQSGNDLKVTSKFSASYGNFLIIPRKVFPYAVIGV